MHKIIIFSIKLYNYLNYNNYLLNHLDLDLKIFKNIMESTNMTTTMQSNELNHSLSGMSTYKCNQLATA